MQPTLNNLISDLVRLHSTSVLTNSQSSHNYNYNYFDKEFNEVLCKIDLEDFLQSYSPDSYQFWELLSQEVSQRKGIDKKLLVGAAYDFSSQFLNLFRFSVFVSFVWCII